jgi:hypothetical protein
LLAKSNNELLERFVHTTGQMEEKITNNTNAIQEHAKILRDQNINIGCSMDKITELTRSVN